MQVNVWKTEKYSLKMSFYERFPLLKPCSCLLSKCGVQVSPIDTQRISQSRPRKLAVASIVYSLSWAYMISLRLLISVMKAEVFLKKKRIMSNAPQRCDKQTHKPKRSVLPIPESEVKGQDQIKLDMLFQRGKHANFLWLHLTWTSVYREFCDIADWEEIVLKPLVMCCLITTWFIFN